MPLPAFSSPGLNALLGGCAFASTPAAGWLRITGDDRVRWLNGMVTNSVQALRPGEGCPTFVLSAQGRIQGEGTIFLLEDAILFRTQPEQVEPLHALLDRYIIMDDVELTPVAEGSPALTVAGPHAARLLANVLPEWEAAAGVRLLEGKSGVDRIAHLDGPLAPRWEISGEASGLDQVASALTTAGAIEASPEDMEHLRLLEGTPRFTVDMRDRDLPQETALPGASSPALHFSKGCYLGQEIVERIRSRGNVHRTRAGLMFEGERPAAGTALTLDGKPVGEVTSAAAIPLQHGTLLLGMGYVRREAQQAALSYDGGHARLCPLPYTGA